MPADLVAEQDFATAEELLAVLSPSDKRWIPDMRDWAFRGHADKLWHLVPRVLRQEAGKPEPWLRHLDVDERAEAGDPDQRDFLRMVAEFRAVERFMIAADRAGLAIPEDSQALRSTQKLAGMLMGPLEDAVRRGTDSAWWPPRELLSIVALAQHHGVHTRLLDWSWKPRVAAYMAASTVTGGQATLTSDRLAVWALRTWGVTQAWVLDPDPVPASIVTAPQATNPNLSAQAGLFTVVRSHHENVGLDEVLEERLSSGKAPYELKERPLVWKLTLPHAQAARLLRLLGLDGVNAATVYPGYDGVVRSLEEELLWEK